MQKLARIALKISVILVGLGFMVFPEKVSHMQIIAAGLLIAFTALMELFDLLDKSKTEIMGGDA